MSSDRAMKQDRGNATIDTTTVSISNTFHPGANLLPSPTDLLLMTSDGVAFYVHAAQLLSVSDNNFNDTTLAANLDTSTISTAHNPSPATFVTETADTLNIILHSVYGISCASYSPSLDTLVASVDAMPTYGLAPKTHVAPSTVLHGLLLAQAPAQPLTVYALASRHDLYEVASPVSSHLLSVPLHALSDDVVGRIDSVYLKRLFLLHLERLAALKALLLPPPHPHPATAHCDFDEQKKVARAWTLAASYLASEHNADVSPSTIEGAFASLGAHVWCQECKRSLADRIKELLARWSSIKRTI
ncbi:hypothetical protein C8Q77DRAFT_232290 [Trametes polyzona]|nr:hypothetical protein C8Q77DRAFT_232290 [Trametes polyzona]